MKTTLLDQIRKRRLILGVKIQDMPLLAGLTRQQYGKIEAGGNPRLSTLDQIAEGLGSVLMLVPKSKMLAVQKLLASETADFDPLTTVATAEESQSDFNTGENPWGNI